WYWSPTCSGHDIFLGKESSCGWSEGWADFFALTVDAHKVGNAVCYDKGIGPCTGIRNTNYFDLENQGWNDGQPQGDTVEGRVAGALYDLFDYANDGYDQIGFGFGSQIWNSARTAPSTFLGFWNNWKARGYEKHASVQSIYQNTIDYDLFPSFNNLPNPTLLQGITYNHAVDLWLYASDPESANWQMTYAFVSSTDTRCGASVDSHYVNFSVQSGWSGSCNVTVRAYDGIKGTNGTFTVNVVPVRGRNYLPFISK
ncbi:MAG: hypothetical protein KGJ80_08350, partial [Chloroflexota bacterium]|nr:hypothetical protein [Chloroflexota bacterium]